ncbi:hypothetical protein FA13DRAFT_1735591, partial [Coprinellus micaceus]
MDPLARLFSSNSPPHPTEVALIRDRIDADMAAIQELQVRVRRYKALTSPLRGVPLEILGEIFMLVVASVKQEFPVTKQVVRLCLVSRTWRNAALATPSLWGRVGIIWSSGVDSTTFSFKKVESWLSRSREIPRALTVDSVCAHRRDSPCKMINPSLALLLSNGPSLQQLSLSCDLKCFQQLSTWIMESSQTVQTRPWDSLGSMDLKLSGASHAVQPSFADEILAYVPTVTSLSLSGFSLRDEMTDIGTSPHAQNFLSNLTTLSIPFMYPTVWEEDFLSHCSQRLQELTLDFDYFNEEPSSFNFNKTISFPCLHVLRIREYDMDCEEGFLRLFSTPVLIELDLGFASYDPEHVRYDGDGLGDGLAAFLTRSNCKATLARLRLAHINLTGDSLHHILLKFPQVTHLTMDYVDVDSTEFFAGPHDPKAKLLPNIVDFCWLHAFEDTDFKKICHYFYTHKFQGAGRLRRLVIELPERVEEYSEAAEAK